VDLNELNNFSYQILASVEKQYPQWTKAIQSMDVENGNWKLKIRSDIKTEEVLLIVSTKGDDSQGSTGEKGQISWRYDYSEENSFYWTGQAAFNWLKNEMDAFLNGQLYIASIIENNKCIETTKMDKIQLKEYFECLHQKGIIPLTVGGLMKKALDSKKCKLPKYNRIAGWEKIYLF
jgi:hypothetical protein